MRKEFKIIIGMCIVFSFISLILIVMHMFKSDNNVTFEDVADDVWDDYSYENVDDEYLVTDDSDTDGFNTDGWGVGYIDTNEYFIETEDGTTEMSTANEASEMGTEGDEDTTEIEVEVEAEVEEESTMTLLEQQFAEYFAELEERERLKEEEVETETETEEIESETIIAEVVEEPKGPPTFILDMDFSDDADDVLAVSVAMDYMSNQKINVIGVALECTSQRATQAMNALLAAHGYWDIPVACDIDEGVVMHGPYHLGMESFKHKTDYWNDTNKLYRTLLAGSPEKVNIVTTGQVINIERLLKSKPDSISPLSGMELVTQKVEHIYVVGCKASGKPENNMFYVGTNYGGNIHYGTTDAADAGDYIADHCPVPITFMYAELGGLFNTGQFFTKSDPKSTDIITKALTDWGTNNGRASFDPMGVVIAVEDSIGNLNNLHMTKVAGTMRIFSNGSSKFTAGESTRNHYIVEKHVEDSFYQQYINKMLINQFVKRTGRTIKW